MSGSSGFFPQFVSRPTRMRTLSLTERIAVLSRVMLVKRCRIINKRGYMVAWYGHHEPAAVDPVKARSLETRRVTSRISQSTHPFIVDFRLDKEIVLEIVQKKGIRRIARTDTPQNRTVLSTKLFFSFLLLLRALLGFDNAIAESEDYARTRAPGNL